MRPATPLPAADEPFEVVRVEHLYLSSPDGFFLGPYTAGRFHRDYRELTEFVQDLHINDEHPVWDDVSWRTLDGAPVVEPDEGRHLACLLTDADLLAWFGPLVRAELAAEDFVLRTYRVARADVLTATDAPGQLSQAAVALHDATLTRTRDLETLAAIENV